MVDSVTNKMLFTLEKLQSRINNLSKYRYRDTISLDEAYVVECTAAANATTVYPPKQYNSETMKIGDTWYGRDKYLWLSSKNVNIPKSWEGKKIIALVQFPQIQGGLNGNFEGLLYINKKPYQGIDSNHTELYLPKDCPGNVLDFDIRFWSYFDKEKPRKYTLKQLDFCWLDEIVDDLYYLALNTLDTYKELGSTSSDAINLLKILNKAFLNIDWSYENYDLDKFYETLYETRDILRSEIEKTSKNSDITINCIGHTHIDVAWQWRLKHTREKATRSFTTVLRLMELYPDYLFLQSQPQLYDYMKEDYPEIYSEIKERVKEGRWETEGAMWVESDCNIPSGESLVRQILLGKKFLKEEFGHDSNYLWLPDVFGYSWALPQILKKSGVDTFMTTKISWNQYNRMPHDTFMWRGLDGTEILTHFITTPGAWIGAGPYVTTYNGTITPYTVDKIWDKYADKEINNELLIAYGHGDGGGGVDRSMLETRQKLDIMPGMPNVKQQKAGDYFKGLQNRINETTEYVHKWDGELYFEYHRGTYTSQAFTKKFNRKLEFLYRDVETLGVISNIVNNNWAAYNTEKIDEGWKIILRNQFHDIIPGSSIKEVYDDAKLEYAQAEIIGNNSIDNLNNSLLEQTKDFYTAFNSSTWTRSDFIKVNEIKDGIFISENGDELTAQKVEDGYIVYIENMKPLSYISFKFIEENNKISSTIINIDNNEINTPYYNIKIDQHGHLTSIFDKDANREILAESEKGNVILTFEDKPMQYDAWDIDIYYNEKKKEVTNLISMEVIENADLRAVIRFTWEHQNSKIVQDMIVYTNNRRIDFKTFVDWKERQTLMKVAFPVDIRSTKASYDIQYGNVERPTHWNTSWDWARFEVVAHKWADLSESDYGISLMNDCKYGYDIKDNIMRLTLLRSPIHPDPMADYGEHEFTYSLLPHMGTWRDAETEIEAWHFNNELNSSSGYVKENSLFIVNDRNIEIDAIKKCEDSEDVILRFHEYKGSRKNIEISSDYEIISWQETDMMENPISDLVTCNKITTKIKPYEVKTFKVTFKK